MNEMDVTTREERMPWKAKDAKRHTRKAKSARCKRAFAHAANSVLEGTGDEGKAVAAGNAAVNKCNAKSRKRGMTVANSGHRSMHSDYMKRRKKRGTKR